MGSLKKGSRERGSYGFDEESSAFTRPDKRDRCTLPFQLFTHIVRVKLQESVVVVEESYEKYVGWKIERTCKEFKIEVFRSLQHWQNSFKGLTSRVQTISNILQSRYAGESR